MYGDDRVRFCSQCNLNVYNLSALTQEEAEQLILRAEDRLCVRYYRRRDGTILTRNCPVGIQAIKDKFKSTKATLIAATLTLLSYSAALIGFRSEVQDIGVLSVVATKNLVWPDPTTNIVMGDIRIGKIQNPVVRSEKFMRERALLTLIPMSRRTPSAAFKSPARVEITVSAAGLVEEANMISGPEAIRDLVENAASGWTFKPVLIDGSPISVKSTLTFNLP